MKIIYKDGHVDECPQDQELHVIRHTAAHILSLIHILFALKGITPEFCVQEAMHGMMHRRTIIVPSAFMRACTTAQKLLPASLLMPIVARQQKKKMG